MRAYTEPSTLNKDRVQLSPFGPSSEDVLRQGDHALFGVSTGNSYFSRRRLTEAMAWATERFAAVDVVYADVGLEAMLEAFGYERAAARKSVAKQLRGVRRRISGACEDIGAAAEKVRARPLSEFLGEPGYQEVRERTRTALRTDVGLRVARDTTAYRFLNSRLGPGSMPDPAQVSAALTYVEAELPFFIDTPRILGVASSVHCYHSVLPLGHLLFGDRQSGLRPADNQGYAIVECRD
ncbi:tRNA-dependent cyclodipeptide synthase [Streptomyces sp. NPDC046939]|uniref:tRNA-dependent cyclodipeptide synthase n=1 Tax=Streptomyces sp. NPDC046939 TaxID=3155376 RepID=UPI0033E24B9A